VIDSHCHLLPGLDDGPATAAEAVELAARMAADGVEVALCTPHWSRRFPTDHALARTRVDELCGLLARAGVELRLELAAEAAPATALEAAPHELAARSVAGRYLLVEIQPDARSVLLDAVGARLEAADLLPVLAHPERSRAVQDDPSLVDGVRRAGGLVQVVAPSLLGRWGDAVSHCAWALVETGRADLLASDAHGVARRSCRLREAAAAVAERAGAAAAEALTRTGPAAFLRGGAG
jgi:protein-tyrosine phosphatase